MSDDAISELLDQVRCGAKTPEEAERDAADQALGRLSGLSDLALFDVMNEQTWSIDMVLAWIVWRHPLKVTEYSPSYLANCYYWKPLHTVTAAQPCPETDNLGGLAERDPLLYARPIRPSRSVLRISGHMLMPLPLQSVLKKRDIPEVYGLTPHDLPPVIERLSVEDAQAELRNALIDGELIGWAWDRSLDKRVAIPSQDWGLVCFEAAEGTVLSIPHENPKDLEDVEVRYNQLTFRRADVQQLWPISGIASGSDVASLRREYQDWLETKSPDFQMIGEFIRDEWQLRVRPRRADERRRDIHAFLVRRFNGNNEGQRDMQVRVPSEKTISRFIKEFKAFLASRN